MALALAVEALPVLLGGGCRGGPYCRLRYHQCNRQPSEAAWTSPCGCRLCQLLRCSTAHPLQGQPALVCAPTPLRYFPVGPAGHCLHNSRNCFASPGSQPAACRGCDGGFRSLQPAAGRPLECSLVCSLTGQHRPSSLPHTGWLQRMCSMLTPGSLLTSPASCTVLASRLLGLSARAVPGPATGTTLAVPDNRACLPGLWSQHMLSLQRRRSAQLMASPG